MAAAQLGAVLRHIRGLTADPSRDEQNDGALLRAFLRRNDQGAFEALVRRHGPMVLRVCRRALNNVHDAEDALQATFLLLARRAASIRKRESLASWLHGVAYRMAADARKAAARRHRHESRAKPTPPPDPALSAAWKELQALLDEEIARLPETQRAPFVLCCLENQSCAEAAQRLGLEEGAVAMRLSRARKRLQGRLARRGVTLTTLLAAVAVGANGAPAAVPRSAVGAIVNAAARVGVGQALTGGVVSGKVLALMEGVDQAMFLNKCKTAILLLVCTAFVGAGLGIAVVRGAARAEPPPDPPAPPAAAREGAKKERSQPADAPRAEAEESVKVRGRVLDPGGKPLAGAKLYLGGHAGPKAPAYPVRATSGDDGRFVFSLPRSALDTTREDEPAYQVLAVAEGYGIAWVTSNAAAPEDVTLRLVKDAPVKGRILDADGRPFAGARLTVTGVADPKGPGGQPGARAWEGPLPGQAEALTTAADGRFQVAGVGSVRVVNLRLEGRGIATAALEARGAAFEYQAALSRPIRGVVRDKATRKPLAGVSVTSGLCKAVTDKAGRYELLGAAKAARYGLGLNPAEGQLYFYRVVWVQDAPGLEALTADCELVRGAVTVRGKVTDKATGRPVAGARIEYLPLYGNDTAAKMDNESYPRAEATTGADGTYALPVMPGPGVIRVASPRPDAYMPAWITLKERQAFFKRPVAESGFETIFIVDLGGGSRGMLGPEGCHALVLLEPGEKEETLVRDVALEPALQRKGRVVGPDGLPLHGVTVQGLSPRRDVVETLKGAEFTVRGLNPKAPARLLTFHHKGKNLGSFLKELPREKDGPLIVKLQPCGSLTGRIVDSDGQPVAGFRGELSVGDWGGYWGQHQFTTDKQGRFRVEGLAPGLGYSVWQKGKGSVVKIHPGAVAESDKDKDLRDIKALDLNAGLPPGS
jgi:RNA polymerase sigma factor (sigma-70 family)